ncbi:MAG: hypothetical protein OCU22_08185 [Canidatus Methanoxibalbensis ujae]|nr:hypothetical protein [Candidatus Methanoxibalbensis ujae]
MDIVKKWCADQIDRGKERRVHITEHSEMAGYYFEVLETVEEPDYEGKMGECIAVREMEKGKYIVVVYRELSKEDGFVITAFLTRRRSLRGGERYGGGVKKVLAIVPELLEVPYPGIWTSYDN